MVVVLLQFHSCRIWQEAITVVPRMVFNTVLLFVQAAILLLDVSWWILGCGAVFVLLAAVNFRALLQMANRLLHRRKKA